MGMERPTVLDRIQEQEDRNLIADALEHYADALRLAGDHIPVGAGTRNLRKRIQRARHLSTFINQGPQEGRHVFF